MNKLALNIPGFDQVLSPTDVSKNPSVTDLPTLISGLLDIAFFIAGFLMAFQVFNGAFRYLTAGDNKEEVAKARSRITWGIIGFLFVVISFAIAQYIEGIIPKQDVNLKQITPPIAPK